MANDSQEPGPARGDATVWGLDRELEARAIPAFVALLDLPEAERAAALARDHADDVALRDAVAALLRDHEQPPPILTAMVAAIARAPEASAGPGTCIGPYRVVELIGRGGMGLVYRALQDRPHRVVALKVLTPCGNDADLLRRFEREVEVLGLLEHPGISRILGAGSVDLGIGVGRTSYFAMELVAGVPLTAFARDRGLGIAARCELVAQVCDAVQHAHERGVVHRDLKPGNILVADGPGGVPLAKVLDFGIARALHHDGAPAHTGTGLLLGTLPYMSPEQLQGAARGIDARTDVYSLGVVLYELLSGRLPLAFDGMSLGDVCRSIVHRVPAPLGSVDRRLRGDLATIVHKALAKDRAERYESAADLADDLRRHLRHEPILARAPTAFYQLAKFARRNRLLVAAVAAAILVLAAAGVAFAWLAARNEQIGERLRASLYRSQMRLGTEAMDAPGGVGRVRALVEPWLPDAGAADLRGFEWRLLWNSCHRERAVVPCAPAPNELHWLADGRGLRLSHPDRVVFVDANGALQTEHVSGVRPVAVSIGTADGRVLVQSTRHDTLRAFDRQTGAVLATFAHDAPVVAASMSADGRWLACFDGSSITIWAVAAGRVETTLRGAFSGAMAFSCRGERFAAALRAASGGERMLCLWDTGDWSAPRRVLSGAHADVERLVFDHSGRRLGSGGPAGWLQVWDVTTGEQLAAIAHPDGLRAIAFHPHDARIAAGCRNYTAYVHDLVAGTQRLLRGHEGIVAALAWDPDGEALATAGDDRTLRFWDLRRGGERREHDLGVRHPLGHGQLRWNDDGTELTVFGDAGVQGTWCPDDGTFVARCDAVVAGRTIHPLPASAGLACRDPGAAGEHTFPLPDGVGMRAFVVRDDGSRVAVVGTSSGSIWTWAGTAGAATHFAGPAEVRGVAWLADGRLAVVDATDHVRLLDADGGREVASRRVPECTLAVAAGSSGDAVAIGCVDQAVRVWSPARDEWVVLRGHTGHVEAVAFSPDGTRLATGARDRTVRLWDVSAAAEVGELVTGDRVVALAWSPDAQRLAALLAGGRLVLWDARPSTAR